MGKTEPRNFTVEQLAALLEEAHGRFDVYLHRASKWVTWVSPISGDPQLTKVDPNSAEQLTLTYSGLVSETETIKYEPEMQFYLKK